jgi:hypothetical protein
MTTLLVPCWDVATSFLLPSYLNGPSEKSKLMKLATLPFTSQLFLTSIRELNFSNMPHAINCKKSSMILFSSSGPIGQHHKRSHSYIIVSAKIVMMIRKSHLIKMVHTKVALKA